MELISEIQMRTKKNKILGGYMLYLGYLELNTDQGLSRPD